MKKTFKVVMLPTEKATGLFIQTSNYRGDFILIKDRKLEFTTNETLIGNKHFKFL